MIEASVHPNRAALEEAASEIRRAKSIVLSCHVNPDGDALGSMLGLALGLEPLKQTLTLLAQDGVPEIYRFLPSVTRIETTSDTGRFDLAIVLDSGEISRVGDRIRPIVERADRVINIDHHATANLFGDVRLIDSTSASTAEIVYILLQYMDLPINPDVATCLFTGLITDTGSFRFQNVKAGTLCTAAELVSAGAPPAIVAENVFDNRTFAATKVLGSALSSLATAAEGRVVWAHITQEDFIASGATDEDTEGTVNFMRGVRGADVGILFREMPENKIRVSLRARDIVDVSKISQLFGGGGHRMAAGCTVNLPLAEAERAVVKAILDVLPY